MKGFLATALVLMEQVDHSALRAPVHLALSYDEEVGCAGVPGLLDVLATGRSTAGTCLPEVVVVGEPTGMHLAAAAGHSSRAGTEPTAVHEAALLATLVHGLNDSARGISANVGSIHGGVAVNVLAPACTLEFEVRHGADVDPDDLLATVLAAVDDVHDRLAAVGGHATTEAFVRYPALAHDAGSEAVAALTGIVDTGVPGPVAFGTEAGLFHERLGVPCVVVGPGDIADAHRPDESIDPDQLVRCGDVLHRTIERFCA